MVGGENTVMLAVLLVMPVPPLVELTVPVVFDTFPACVPVTFTVIVQVLPGVAMLPPGRLMLVVFAVAVTVPLQTPLTPGVPATCSPFVHVSAAAIPFSAVVLAAGLAMVNVSVVDTFCCAVAAPNCLLMVGGATILSVAVLQGVPVPPSVEVMVPVELAASPDTVPYTTTLSVNGALYDH